MLWRLHVCQTTVAATFNNEYKLMVFIVYFPCQSNDYINELLECLGFIEKCVNLYDYDDIMILDDINFECNTKYTRSNLFLNLCNDINIESADLICGSDIKYTYFQDSTGNNSIIDHIFVSSCLVNDISEYTVCESIVYLSDRLPFVCKFALPVQMIDTKSIHEQTVHRNSGSRRWDKGDLPL